MRRNVYLASKRVFDVVVSILAVVLLSPVMILLALRVKLQRPGSVMRKRKCLTKNGFYGVYEFRSMFVDAENLIKYLTPEQIREYPRNIKAIYNSRVSASGKLLRKTRLDELPQLFNVIKGEMSLVGPRPIAADKAQLYGNDLDEILSVKPGITGYWQIHGRNETDDDGAKRRELELYYVRHQSFLLDVGILAQTLMILVAKLLGRCWRTLTRGTVYRAIKFLADEIGSAVMLVILLPLFVAVAIAIKREDGGEVLHRRICVGKNGRSFIMYKFRSMVADADSLQKYLTSEQIDEYYHNIKVDNDPRITGIGQSIRTSSIDELPQLFNVIKGEMSLVGPRPVAVEEACLYGDDLDEVLSARPGITGYWQTHGRSDATYDSGKRQELELYYVRHQSFILDIKILLKTIVVVLRKEGAK